MNHFLGEVISQCGQPKGGLDMEAYRTYLTITDPGQVILKNVPFLPGQRVEVLLITSKNDVPTISQEIKALFKETQFLPQVKALSDADIEAEVAAYRRNH
jgi:hypothetical protein